MQILAPQRLALANRWAAYQLLPVSATWAESWRQLVYLAKG